MARAHALHILVETKDEAEKLKEQLAQGAKFAELARKHSLCPSGKKGGDLGEFNRGQMVSAFDKIVFGKPTLEVHGPVKTQFGWHLIKTLSRS
ncbi:peptidylprolyl isomerase [Idiomarina abyssalis]|uniref:Peptidyl-prolyl cis-trans isomerase C n=1 Tax=Idiomarina abyssalis TaxID=86102 RepID=A0A8I1G7K6_9GAMM|nr:peptidylprolyl isomerase [Idiomarina abyssalis]MBJ7265901.1 peptidylprolyl isomerase [Idiomarina abyssalis]MBJ7273465.1 peptidylprolyl isomerase [Idiomarina abyssalis]MBJ7314549.1 peptidylprolyl isomerase [Idiomarina abyssalis]